MPENIAEFLACTNWAVTGVSANKEKFGYKVWRQLLDAGYNVYGVNPKLNELEGHPIYPDLDSLPVKPDAVSVVVPPGVTEKVVEDCMRLGIKRVWMQPGSESDRAIARGKEKGLLVIHDQCVLV